MTFSKNVAIKWRHLANLLGKLEALAGFAGDQGTLLPLEFSSPPVDTPTIPSPGSSCQWWSLGEAPTPATYLHMLLQMV